MCDINVGLVDRDRFRRTLAADLASAAARWHPGIALSTIFLWAFRIVDRTIALEVESTAAIDEALDRGVADPNAWERFRARRAKDLDSLFPPVLEAPPPVLEAPPPVLEAPPPVLEAPPPVLEAPPLECALKMTLRRSPGQRVPAHDWIVSVILKLDDLPAKPCDIGPVTWSEALRIARAWEREHGPRTAQLNEVPK